MHKKFLVLFGTKNDLLWIIILTFFLLLSSYFYLNKSLSFHFGDEEHNFAIGKYLSSKEVLYKDLYTNHQPIQFILSSQIQSVFKINSINTLLKRHREFMIAYSFFWSILFFVLFKKKVLFFLFVYELLKINLLGYLFLAESLSVYPLIYLELTLLLRKKLSRVDLFFIGIIVTIAIFLLAPLWPVITLISVLLFIKFKSKKFLITFLGILTVLTVLFKFIDFPNYFSMALVSNIKYTIPSMNYFGPFYLTSIKAFLAPFISILANNPKTPMLVLEQLLSIILLVNLIVLIFLKKYYTSIVIFLTLGLSNIRYYPPGNQFYQGFHSLPWFSSLVIFAGLTSVFIFKFKTPQVIKAINILLISLILVGSFTSSLDSLFKRNNAETDFFVNYSSQFSYGEIVRILGDKSKDTVYTFPEDWLIYWQSNLNHPLKSFGYYIWLKNIPELEKNVLTTFNISPPTFFYCKICETTDFAGYLSLYTRIVKEGHKTDLYMLKTKIPMIKGNQIDSINYYNFSLY